MSDNDRRPTYGLNSNAISGVEDEIDGLFSRRAIRPKDFHATLHKLYDLVEEMQITTRDNNAILCQMLFESEKRMNENIEKVSNIASHVSMMNFTFLSDVVSVTSTTSENYGDDVDGFVDATLRFERRCTRLSVGAASPPAAARKSAHRRSKAA